ncbi:MAG: beta-glucoside-specific PTS transporter subunit IIABC [Termitinemataceae bacterium]|nr:MAG: beta-glucoside-specific PTS transporter subunit IIABC [Termitinemataceae bacterium]
MQKDMGDKGGKMADNKQIAVDVLAAVGGKANVVSVVHCATRLRFKLADEAKADKSKVESTQGVISVVQSGGQFQVVIGNNVSDVYLHLGAMVGNRGDSGGQDVRGNDGLLARFIDLIAGIFTPFMGMMAGAGILKGLLVLVTTLKCLNTASPTYAILNAASDALFYFLPIVLGITAARKFKCNEFIALSIAGALLHPAFMALAGIESPKFLGFMPIILPGGGNYASSVIPILFAVWIQSYVERFFMKHLHLVVRNILAPAITLLIMVPLTILIVGPVTSWISGLLSAGFLFIINLPVVGAVLAGIIIGGLWQVLVIFGLHWAIVPLGMINLRNLGYDPILICAFTAVLAQAAASFAVGLKTKNASLKSIAISAGFSGIFGITEPAIYGVTLRLKKPFVTACVAGAIGGAIIGISGAKMWAFGMPSLLTLPTAISPNTGIASDFVLFVIAVGVTMVLSFIGVLAVGFKDISSPASADSGNGEELPQKKIKAAGKNAIQSPLSGEIVPLDKVKDEAFATGVLGKGIAIIPQTGVLVSPVNGTVDNVFDTKHAISIISDEGAEILIHIGMDTVTLKGAPFTAKVKNDDKVSVGQVLIEFDIKAIQDAGLDTVTPIVIANSDNYESITPVAAGNVAAGDVILKLRCP